MVIVQAAAGSTLVLYIQEAAWRSLLWFIPCFFAIIADAATGRPAARYRKETVTWSRTIRESGNKVIAYISWVLFAVTCSIQYESDAVCGVAIAVIIGNEALSVISNILEPKGFELNFKVIFSIIGNKFHMPNLGNVVKPSKKQENANNT